VAGTAHTLAELANALSEAGVSEDFAELHGGLCGSLCVAGSIGAKAWIEEWMADFAGTSEAQNTLRDYLSRLQTETWAALAGSEFSFEPLLPNEDESLEVQVDGLATWCHGFLSGMGIAGFAMPIGDSAERDPDAETLVEIIGDLTEISRATVDAHDIDDAEGAGFHLAELIEHVRVSVQLTFDALVTHRTETESRTLH
jgi:uncharacterized protein YgfB (UPF0149 family)